MAYIGSTPTSQNFIAGTDYFNGTGSQTAFTLTRPVNSVNDIEVVVNNVQQQPNSYTISGTTLTLSVAPSSGTSNVYVRYLATNQQTIAPSQGTVTTLALADGAVTAAKMGANGTWAPAGTVVQVVSSTYSTATTTTSSSYIDSGLTATITPKFSTSKILVLANVQAGNTTAGGSVGLQAVRNAIVIVGLQNAAFYFPGTSSRGTVSIGYLDSPATTSSTVYKIQYKTNGTGTSQICPDGTTDVCTLTLMEIAQ